MTLDMHPCRSCGAALLWAMTEGGKRIPLDAAPVATGNIALVGFGETPVAHYLKVDEPHAGNRYVSHFATCPQSRAWRKGR